MQSYRLIGLALTTLSVAAAAACTSSGSPDPEPSASNSGVATPATPSTTSVTTTSPSSSPTSPGGTTTTPADPRVAAALTAYRNFSQAATYALSHPPKKLGDPLPTNGNFRPYSFDPAQGQYLGFVLNLQMARATYVGSPPQPRVQVQQADLAAEPYPLVTLTDCPTPAPSWRVVATSGGSGTTRQTSKMPPPYLSVVQVIFYKRHWGVSKVTTNTSRTCRV